MDLSLKIDVVSNIGEEEFKRKYFKTHTPVVIKGITQNTFAEHNWTFDYFKKTMGDVKVDLYDNRNTKNRATAFTTPDLRMKFVEFLDILSKNEYTPYRIFLFDLFKHNPELKKEFPCPKIIKGVLARFGRVFFAGRDTPVRIHYDTDMSNVILTQFGGRKRVILFPPSYKEMLYCLPLNTHSLINVDKPDYDKYPALQYVKGYDVMLEPGDSIFMPCGYWHYMTYIDGGFSVAYRKMDSSIKTVLGGVANLAILIPIDKALNNIFGNRWVEMKEQTAERRANKALDKQFLGEYNSLSGV